MATIEELESLRWDLRRDCVDIIMAGVGGHIGGDMSVIDALMTLYANHLNISPETVDDPNRDRFVLSKGHAMEAYYAVLCHEGYLDLDDVKARFSKFGSPYIGHPNNKLKGIEMNSGSLGHGLPVAVGMALAGKMDGRDYRVYTIMGDGELAEGSVWEGAMSGGNYQLDNLCALVDRNRLQISGSTEDVMKQDSQEERWAAFGWNVLSIPGNDVRAIDAALTLAAETSGKPTVIILNTVKGYGSPVMEDKAPGIITCPTMRNMPRSSPISLPIRRLSMANKIANRKVICDTLLEAAATDKDIVVLCSDSRAPHRSRRSLTSIPSSPLRSALPSRTW